MRRKLLEQLGLVTTMGEHVQARELEMMSYVLDGTPQAIEVVYRDLVAGSGNPDKGRDTMTAEQVLRALIVMKRFDLSYDQLAFELADSNSIRTFCRISLSADVPSKSALQRNIKKVTDTTLEQINKLVVAFAQDNKIENGRKTRTDCTVVETNIHDPTDSSLLWDCVRVLCRLMDQAREAFGIPFNSRRRRAKRRAIGILNAKSNEQRVPLYRDLLKTTEDAMTQASRVAESLKDVELSDIMQALRAESIAHDLKHYVSLAQRVVNQTERRVLRGESVPASDKIVSIFETHTDIIVKARRETLYGHKVCLTTGASGLVLDLVVEKGNPADSTLASKMISRVATVLGLTPKQATFDGGFSSTANVGDIKKMGVEDVVFSKHVGLEISDMAKSKGVFRKLRNFRAGVEAGISWLKRIFGLRRCKWSGFKSFSAYAWASALSCNLLLVARHLLA